MPRPRRTAALRANEAITDMADSDHRPMSRERRARGGPNVSRDPPSSPGDHLNLNIKVSSNKLRQATVGRDGVRTEQQISVNSGRDSGRGASGRRSRGGRKNYVVESDSDEEEEEELDLGDDDEEDDDDDDAEGEEDADGEVDEMELDADGEADDDPGEEDADGDVDMDAENSTITVSKPKGGSRARQSAANSGQRALYEEDDDDDVELSDPGPSDIEETITYGATGGDEDAEGEEIEVAGEEEEEEEEGDAEGEEVELDSDGEPISGEPPDLAKMTRRQRARFEDQPQDYMKLSDGKDSKYLDYTAGGANNDVRRGASQENFHRRGAFHAPRGNGAPAEEPEREAQRGSKGKALLSQTPMISPCQHYLFLPDPYPSPPP